MVGVGHAEKAQVAMMVRMLLPTSDAGIRTPPTRSRSRSATPSIGQRGEGRGMIGKLRGVVDSVDQDDFILDVNGVGYLVAASATRCAPSPRAGKLRNS